MSQLSIEDAVKLGLEHHRAGRLADAEQIYRQVLNVDVNHPDALHLLGALALQAGQMQIAVELLSRAVVVNGGVADFHWNLGRALAGCARWAESAAAYERAIALRPGVAEIWNDLGNTLQLGGQWKRSVAAYERAIELKPDFADAWNNLGSAQTELREFDSAFRSLRRAMELRPEYPEAHNNLGNALQEMGKCEESLKEYELALAQRASYARVYPNMGRALRSLDRRDEAMAAFAKAIELNPESPDAHNALATSYLDECRIEESIASFRRAIELRPAFAEAHHNLGRVLLLKGDYEQGWKEYEWRWGMKDVLKNYPQLQQPLWDGSTLLIPTDRDSDLNGRTILLHAEQGFGDTIQFARYAPLVKARGGRVILAVQPELGRLMHGAAGVDRVVIEGGAVPKFDVRCPLLSLPRLFGTIVETIPPASYLAIDEREIMRWRERLAGSESRLKVGLAWAGRPTFKDDRWRSLRFDLLSPILDVPNVSFHSMQKGEAAKQIGESPRVKDWSNELTDFADTAALLMNLDLLITTDTAVVHLAGSLDRRVWVLIPFSPDWRWLLDREDSPWYPTMRLFRQEKFGDWETPVRRIREALEAL